MLNRFRSAAYKLLKYTWKAIGAKCKNASIYYMQHKKHMFFYLRHIPNTIRLPFKFRLARTYQWSRWCEWQMFGVSCATMLVVIQSKCKAQRWRTSSSCLNTKSFRSVSFHIFFLFFPLVVQTPSFRTSRDRIAQTEEVNSLISTRPW